LQFISNLIAPLTEYSALSYSYQNVKFALEKTSETKTEALLGLMPIVLFYGEIIILF